MSTTRSAESENTPDMTLKAAALLLALMPEKKDEPRKSLVRRSISHIHRALENANDAWDGMRLQVASRIPETASHTIGLGFGSCMAILGGILGMYGSAQAFFAAHQAKSETLDEQAANDLQLRSAALTFLLSGAATGLSSYLFATLIAIKTNTEFSNAWWITGATTTLNVMPVAIAATFTAMAFVSLCQKSIAFSRARDAEEKARQNYEVAKKEYERAQGDLTIAMSFPVRPALEPFQNKINVRRDALKDAISVWNAARTKRLDAERELAFAAVNMGSAVFALAGTILATAAFVGGSIASMGALPLALLIIGAAVSIFSRIFEWLDKKYAHRPTNWIRSQFASEPRVSTQGLFGSNPPASGGAGNSPSAGLGSARVSSDGSSVESDSHPDGVRASTASTARLSGDSMTPSPT